MKKFYLVICGLVTAFAAEAQIIHVPGDYPTIQQGINAAGTGDTILVSEGTYYEQVNFRGKKPLMVASEFLMDGQVSHIANTIINGSQISSTDTASVVLFVSGEDSTAVLCGFTITGGRGTLDYFPAVGGGGIYARNSGLKLCHNIITGNDLNDANIPGSVGVNGAGIFIDNEIETWSIIENNEISYNTLTTSNVSCLGGALCLSGNSRARENVIRENSTYQNSVNPDCYNIGGGMYCWSYMNPIARITFKDNLFENNHLNGINGFGAGALIEVGRFYWTGNHFKGNSISGQLPQPYGGGGLVINRPDAGSKFSGNSFINNEVPCYGGGLYVNSTENLQKIDNNFFFGNKAHFGGAIMSNYSVAIYQNNVFYSNEAEYSGGAFFLNDDANLIHSACLFNNSFLDNHSAPGGGHSIFSSWANPLILNSVFWQSSAIDGPEIRNNGSYVEVAYSNIDTNLISYTVDLIVGPGMINEDPLFTDTLLNISGASPCIDVGVAEYYCHNHNWEAPVYDIENLVRPWDNGFDMGAHEYGSIPWTGIPGPVRRSQHPALVCFPNPFSEYTTIEFTLDQSAEVKLSIFNQLGEEVAQPVNGMKQAGKHQVGWLAGEKPEGLYFGQLKVDNRLYAIKFLKVK